MLNSVTVEGAWPGTVALSAGWFRARSRPWNDSVPAPMIRLDRGGADFLSSVTTTLHRLSDTEVYSPAMYPGATRVWRRSGFEEHARLSVMEKLLGHNPRPFHHEVRTMDDPDWEPVAALDRTAFETFWQMSRLGLAEAHATNRTTTLLTTNDEDRLSGYAIVGCQWGVAYLHRIAVGADFSSRGFGTSLLHAAMEWGLGVGGRSMVLNVRPDNTRAINVYDRAGFTMTGTDLVILRHDAGE